MITYLNIVEGPLKGFRFKARPGITIGGKESHIDLKDESIDGIHAKLIKDENEQICIQAENESKGTYVDSQRIKKQLLKDNSKIRIGKTTFVVTIKLNQSTEIKLVEEPKDLWTDILRKKYQEFSQLKKEKPIQLMKMEPIINLHFVKGLQLKTDWTLGYGPRIVGPDSIDLKIFEPKAPDICFELIPTDKGVLYQTDHADTVTINQQKLKQKYIETNDKIKIYNTEILVSVYK